MTNKDKDRRQQPRLPIMKNVGEPVELQVVLDHRRISLPGFILNLSSGGMGIVTLGTQAEGIPVGTTFLLDLKMGHLHSHNVEGKIVRIEKGEKAKLHHNSDEWYLALSFTKIKPSDAHHINRMAEDWAVCETKIQMNLPDICFKDCSCWTFCEKIVKLAEKK
jgi:hypothetical protein